MIRIELDYCYVTVFYKNGRMIGQQQIFNNVVPVCFLVCPYIHSVRKNIIRVIVFQAVCMCLINKIKFHIIPVCLRIETVKGVA